jgi:prepilin-type N-terminal cleavage/methylation domain-containing protein
MARRGFTLVEVMVALVLAGIAVSTAVGVFASTGDTVRRLGQESRAWTHRGNARVWLSDALASAEVDATGGIIFDGDRESVRFRGWQWSPKGWVEPADIEVSFVGGRLRATNGSGAPLVLSDSIEGIALSYLPTWGEDTEWLPRWRSDSGLPAAVRLIVWSRARDLPRSDTSIVLVGVGG